jgi:hypothetical protein
VQAFDAWAVQVARDSQLPIGYRYLVQRLAELLDARAGLVVSGAALSSPGVLLQETQDVLDAHLADSQNPTANLASAHCAVTLARLEQEPRLSRWYGRPYDDACDHLRIAVAARTAPGPPPQGIGLSDWRKAEFLAVVRCQRSSVSPQWRPSDLPAGGHVFSPLVAIGSPQRAVVAEPRP